MFALINSWAERERSRLDKANGLIAANESPGALPRTLCTSKNLHEFFSLCQMRNSKTSNHAVSIAHILKSKCLFQIPCALLICSMSSGE